MWSGRRRRLRAVVCPRFLDPFLSFISVFTEGSRPDQTGRGSRVSALSMLSMVERTVVRSIKPELIHLW